MGWPYQKLVSPLLFAQDAESAHDFTLKILSRASEDKFICNAVGKFFSAPELPVELFGLKFPNPIGVAAGMDKFAAAVPIWEKFGFGFCELGGVTWHAQPGNPPPRMFRAVADEAIINRMGFNNPGAEAVAEKLSASSFRVLRDLADFFVVNVSSPNTPGLRQLQDKVSLDGILVALQEVQSPKSEIHDQKPVLVKVAPDLSFEALDEILELAVPRQIAGIVATNTTISRPHTNDSILQKIYSETGGLSGRPLRARSTEIIRHIFKQTRGQLPIIGVGGIFNADDAWEKITAGASLVQIYTGLVYEGPALAKKIVTSLVEKLKKSGMKNLPEAVGSS